jgi:tRNA U34 5-carboxymethylaminomethyl modifying GTPase MnmE/TrmE
MSEIQDMMTGISKPPRRSLSTSVSWEDVQVSSADELDSLKSALAMVASLAKQAHDATLVERQNHTERIKQLEEQLQFAAESKEEPSPAPSS